MAVVDAALDQVVAVAGQRLMRRVGDLAGQAEAARRIAVRAGVALDEDAVEHRVLGVVDPVLLGEVLAADADVDAAHRDVAQSRAAASRISSGASSPIAGSAPATAWC